LHVAELTPPLLSVVFWSAPRPMSAAETPASHPHAMHRPKPAAHALVAPTAPQPQAPPSADLREGPPSTDPPGPPGPPGPPCLGANCATAPPCAGAGCISAPAPKPPRNVGPHALDAERIAGATPHLPAAVIDAHRGLGESRFVARMCVDTAGVVSSVTVLAGIPGADADIVATLRGWRYKPQPIPVCFVTELLYDVQ
jgi:hypothetical protein